MRRPVKDNASNAAAVSTIQPYRIFPDTPLKATTAQQHDGPRIAAREAGCASRKRRPSRGAHGLLSRMPPARFFRTSPGPQALQVAVAALHC
jgi:hypothetical protein